MNREKYFRYYEKNGWKKAKTYRKACAPTKLYKYVSLSSKKICSINNQYCGFDEELDMKKIECLHTKTVWMSVFDKLNDPFEFNAISFDIDQLCDKNWPIDLLHQAISNIKMNYLISSFTTNVTNNMPMWAHYANNHQGFCIEYEVVNGTNVYPISYETNRHKLSGFFTNFIMKMNEVYDGLIPEDDPEYQEIVGKFTHMALIKHKSWDYENEYRILQPNQNKSSLGNKIDECDMGLKLSKIYIGARCSNNHIEKLVEVSKLRNIDIYKMHFNVNNEEYALEVAEI